MIDLTVFAHSAHRLHDIERSGKRMEVVGPGFGNTGEECRMLFDAVLLDIGKQMAHLGEVEETVHCECDCASSNVLQCAEAAEPFARLF